MYGEGQVRCEFACVSYRFVPMPAAGVVITGRSRSEVDEALNSDIAKAFALSIPAEMWAAHRAQHPLGQQFTGAQDLIPQTIDEHTVLSYTAQVPVSLMKEFFLTGTPQDVIGQVAEWRDHGLRYLVAINLAPTQPAQGAGGQRTVLQDPPRTQDTISGKLNSTRGFGRRIGQSPHEFSWPPK